VGVDPVNSPVAGGGLVGSSWLTPQVAWNEGWRHTQQSRWNWRSWIKKVRESIVRLDMANLCS